MPQQSLTRRVGILEEKVASLEELPERLDRLESQLLQFREENRVEHSAILAEVRAGDEETRRFAQGLVDDAVARLKDEIRAGDEETRRYMRVLYEDLVERIATIGEGGNRPQRRH